MKKPTKHHEPQVIPDGRFVKLIRPNLWHGMNAIVEGYRNGRYICRVTPLDKTSFAVEVRVEEIQAV